MSFHISVRDTTDLDPTVASVLAQEMKPIYGTLDPLSLNRQFLEKNTRSYPHIFAGKCDPTPADTELA